jgi:aminomethyltransferase
MSESKVSLRRTPLYDWHASHNGRIVEFGGWEMPVQYTSIVEEHHAVRKAAGLFDISHMGRLQFTGAGAPRVLDHLVTSRVDTLAIGQIRYGLMCNDAGGVLDDVLVYRNCDNIYGLVVNAGNADKIRAWIEKRHGAVAASEEPLTPGPSPRTTEAAVPAGARGDEDAAPSPGSPDFQMTDLGGQSVMLALQGPKALAILQRLTTTDLGAMKYYTCIGGQVAGIPTCISRTGYTGEDGFELIAFGPAVELWEKLLATGKDDGLVPCGLGCRDTLRLEAAMPLYGHELNENVDPLTAGLSFAVKFDKSGFIGRDALLKIKDVPNRPKRVGLKLNSRRIAREHSEVYAGADRIGEVSSGTFSPTLEQSIAMAYIAAAHAAIGTAVEVDIRGKREPANVVQVPFYKRPV